MDSDFCGGSVATAATAAAAAATATEKQQQQQQQQQQERKVQKEQVIQQVKEEKKEKQVEKEIEKKHEWKREAQRQLELLGYPELQYMIAVDASGSSRQFHLQSDMNKDYDLHKPFQTNWTYARTIDILGQVLERERGSENFISYAFGCKNHALQWICRRGYCPTFQTFLDLYTRNGLEIGAKYTWGWDTSSLGAVFEAARTCIERKCYTILFILTDGEMRDDLRGLFKVIENSLPMSVIFVRIASSSENHIDDYPGQFRTTVGDIHFVRDEISKEELAKQVTEIIKIHYPRVVTKLSSPLSLSLLKEAHEQIVREGE